MSSAITIRPYVTEDVDTIINIFRRAVHETASKDYNADQIAAWAKADKERWLKRCSGRQVWIAEIDNTAAGFTEFEINGHLDMMYVHPGFQNRGVAGRLLKTAEEKAKSLYLRRIFTEASITAKPFFMKKGFSVIIEQLVEIRGQQLKNFRMEKFL